MGSNRISRNFSGRSAASLPLTCVAAAAILLTAAMAQESANKNAQASAEEPGFFGGIVNWVDRQVSGIGSHLKGAGSQVENFGHEAGIAAKTTVDGAKDVGDAVVKIP